MTISDVITGRTLEGIYRRSPLSPIERSELVGALRSAQQRESLCVVAGAGISIPYGLPTWVRLIDRLSVGIREPYLSRNRDLITKYFIHRSPLILARSFKMNMRYPSEFADAVGRALYEGYSYTTANTAMSALADVMQDYVTKSRKLKIITFNYDSLLEEEMSARRCVDYSVVYDEQTYRSAERPLRISHVHGWLPRSKYMQDDARTAGFEESERSENIILSEDDYHSSYQLNYSWSNIELISTLTNFTCLYVGISFDDPNLRRVIDIANLFRRPFNHILVSRRLSAGDSVYPNSAEALTPADASIINDWQELILSEMGIRTYHVNDYSELYDVVRLCI